MTMATDGCKTFQPWIDDSNICIEYEPKHGLCHSDAGNSLKFVHIFTIKLHTKLHFMKVDHWWMLKLMNYWELQRQLCS